MDFTLEETLVQDFDNFFYFCRAQKAEESLAFWTDCQRFKERYFEIPPPPPSPKEEAPNEIRPATSTTLLRRFSLFKSRPSLTSTKFSTKSERSNSSPNVSWSVATTTHASDLSRFSVKSNSVDNFSPSSVPISPPLNPNKQASRKELLENALNNQGSSLIKIHFSLARNLTLRLQMSDHEYLLFELAQTIFFKYLDVNSPHWVCLTSDIVQALEEQLESGQLSCNMFDAAQGVVFHELKINLHPQYIKKNFVLLKEPLSPPPPVPMEGNEKSSPSAAATTTVIGRLRKLSVVV